MMSLSGVVVVTREAEKNNARGGTIIEDHVIKGTTRQMSQACRLRSSLQAFKACMKGFSSGRNSRSLFLRTIPTEQISCSLTQQLSLELGMLILFGIAGITFVKLADGQGWIAMIEKRPKPQDSRCIRQACVHFSVTSCPSSSSVRARMKMRMGVAAQAVIQMPGPFLLLPIAPLL